MKQNNAMLLALGLSDAATVTSAGSVGSRANAAKRSRPSAAQRKKKKQELERRRAAALHGNDAPVRRSTRIRKLANPSLAAAVDAPQSQRQHHQQQQQRSRAVPAPMVYEFEDSSVYRYLCSTDDPDDTNDQKGSARAGGRDGTRSGDSGATTPTPGQSSLAQFAFAAPASSGVVGVGGGGDLTGGTRSRRARPLEDLKGFAVDATTTTTLHDPMLKKIYNIDIGGHRGRLLAAAGHQGRVAVFVLDAVRRRRLGSTPRRVAAAKSIKSHDSDTDDSPATDSERGQVEEEDEDEDEDEEDMVAPLLSLSLIHI